VRREHASHAGLTEVALSRRPHRHVCKQAVNVGYDVREQAAKWNVELFLHVVLQVEYAFSICDVLGEHGPAPYLFASEAGSDDKVDAISDADAIYGILHEPLGEHHMLGLALVLRRFLAQLLGAHEYVNGQASRVDALQVGLDVSAGCRDVVFNKYHGKQIAHPLLRQAAAIATRELNALVVNFGLVELAFFVFVADVPLLLEQQDVFQLHIDPRNNRKMQIKQFQ